MKKMFFLSMMFFSLVTNAFALDLKDWTQEKKIYLGEFEHNRAELTREMANELLSIVPWSSNQAILVYVRTDSSGNIDANKKLAGLRNQSLVRAIRGLVKTDVLPDYKIAVLSGNFDLDGINNRGATVIILKPNQGRSDKEVIAANNPVRTPGVESDNSLGFKAVGLAAFGCIILLILLVLYSRNKQAEVIEAQKKEAKSQTEATMSIKPILAKPVEVKIANKQLSVAAPVVTNINLDRLGKIPRVVADNKFGKKRGMADIYTCFVIDGHEIWCFGHKNEHGEFPTFHIGANGLYATDNKKRWRRSVESSVRQWLTDQNGSELIPTDFSQINHVIQVKDLVITS